MSVRTLIEELIAAWQSNDAHRAAAFFSPEAVYHESGSVPIVGRDAILEHFMRFFRDGPAWRIEPGEIIVEGERAAVAYRFSMTLNGTWTAREGCALVRTAGGLVAEWREYHGE